MSFAVAFAIGPWLGTLLLDRQGPAALWGGSFLFGCLSAALMARIDEPPVHAQDDTSPLPPSGEVR